MRQQSTGPDAQHREKDPHLKPGPLLSSPIHQTIHITPKATHPRGWGAVFCHDESEEEERHAWQHPKCTGEGICPGVVLAVPPGNLCSQGNAYDSCQNCDAAKYERDSEKDQNMWKIKKNYLPLTGHNKTVKG